MLTDWMDPYSQFISVKYFLTQTIIPVILFVYLVYGSANEHVNTYNGGHYY